MADESTNLYIRKEADDGWWIIGGEHVRQNASFVTVNAEGDLGSERVLTGGNSITVTDGGANTTVTVSLDTPGTLTVATANAAAAPHTHAVTSSSNPGAAASILASSAAGELTLVGLTLSGLTASTVIYSDAAKKITSLANAAGYLTNNGAGVLSWSAGATPSAHNVLSASHGDTLADNVVDGDVIIGNATPKWSRLARSVPAANVRNVLGIDNGETRPSWKTALDGNNPTTLTVSTAAAPGTSLVFSHRDHAHPITSSSNPGAAASILASSAAGELTLVGLTLSGLTASTVIYSDAAKKITSLANAAGYLYNDGAGALSWAAGVAHDLLSATHSDTLAAAVTDGDIIIGNGTPKWSELAISVPAANVRNVLGVDNGETRPSWKTALDGNNPTTLTVSLAAAPGTSLVFSHRDHAHAITSSSNPGAAASLLASSAAGELTLVGLTLSGLTASTVIYSDAAKKITSLANAAGYLTNNGAGALSWSSAATPSAHDLLSASHGDTATAAVTDGDIIIGNGTPKWSELAISVPAANVRNVLGVDNGETRPSWKTALDGNDPATLTVSAAAAAGTSLIFSHRDHVHPVTSSSNPGGAASLLASAADGGLQLLRLGVGTDPDTDNAFKVVDDAWIGLGAAAGRLAFDSTPDPDQIDVADADLYFATASRGIIHVDGNQDGKVLVADGTRYVPGDISDITGGDAQYVVMAANATLDNERVLTAGDGIDLTDGGAGGNVTVAVDVTDILGSGLTEAANNIALDWGAPVIGTIECDDAADAGVGTNPARSDHQHAIVCAAPSTSLSSSTTNSEGSATSFARSDHTHAISGIAYDDDFITPPLEPAQITGDQNNYNPGDDTFVRLTADADGHTITGWQNGVSGKWKMVYNASTAGRNIIFAHEDAASTDVNRFYFGGLADVELAPLSSFLFIWHANRWRQFIGPALA